MKIYRMDPAKFPKERQTILKIYLSTLAVLGLGAAVFAFVRRLPLGTLWWLPVILALLVYYMVNAIRNTRRIFDEFTLEWDGAALKQNTPGLPELFLPASEIALVDETKQGLQLSTKTHTNVLTIPHTLSDEDFKELKEELSAWAEKTAKP
ncbi:MAG: hypothetical protein VB108_01715 [Anaerolineaceae bacterium]|nr:hypothetical protein [Anaerolineaceae bacterium]